MDHEDAVIDAAEEAYDHALRALAAGSAEVAEAWFEEARRILEAE